MGDLFVRHLEAIDILHGGSNVAWAHTAPIEGENLALYGGDVALMLLDNLRLERALAVTRHMDGDFAQCGLERLFGIAICGHCRWNRCVHGWHSRDGSASLL